LIACLALAAAASLRQAMAAESPAASTRPTTAPVGDTAAAQEIIRLVEYAIAVPLGWRDFRQVPRRFVLFRQGDGIGVPPIDETGAPLQVGLTIEKFRSGMSAKEGAAELEAAARAAPQLELIGEPKQEPITLADGTEAILLISDFVKEGHRHSLQLKLLATDARANAWVVSAFAVGGKESAWPSPSSALGRWLRAHLITFVLDPAKLDASHLPGPFDPGARPDSP
jgi:hypothetical protein